MPIRTNVRRHAVTKKPQIDKAHTMNNVKFEVTNFNKATEQYRERNMKLAVEVGFEEANI